MEPAALHRARERGSREREHEQGDRHRDVEHPGPAHILGQHSTEEDTGCSADRRCGSVYREGLREVGGASEEHHEQRERGGSDQCGASTLDRATGDLEPDIGGSPGQKRACDEDDPPDDEDLPGSEHIGQPPAEQQQTAEGHDVGVEHPRERLGGEAEVALDVRQSHSDDRGVHDDDELRSGDQYEAEPALRSWCGRAGHCFLLGVRAVGPVRHHRIPIRGRGIQK